VLGPARIGDRVRIGPGTHVGGPRRSPANARTTRGSVIWTTTRSSSAPTRCCATTS
jgi:hypothetical protein